MGAVVLLAVARSKDENMKKNLCFWTSIHFVRARPASRPVQLRRLEHAWPSLPRGGGAARRGALRFVHMLYNVYDLSVVAFVSSRLTRGRACTQAEKGVRRAILAYKAADQWTSEEDGHRAVGESLNAATDLGARVHACMHHAARAGVHPRLLRPAGGQERADCVRAALLPPARAAARSSIIIIIHRVVHVMYVSCRSWRARAQ
jgi:hypothetical protein